MKCFGSVMAYFTYCFKVNCKHNKLLDRQKYVVSIIRHYRLRRHVQLLTRRASHEKVASPNRGRADLQAILAIWLYHDPAFRGKGRLYNSGGRFFTSPSLVVIFAR